MVLKMLLILFMTIPALNIDDINNYNANKPQQTISTKQIILLIPQANYPLDTGLRIKFNEHCNSHSSRNRAESICFSKNRASVKLDNYGYS